MDLSHIGQNILGIVNLTVAGREIVDVSLDFRRVKSGGRQALHFLNQ